MINSNRLIDTKNINLWRIPAGNRKSLPGRTMRRLAAIAALLWMLGIPEGEVSAQEQAAPAGQTVPMGPDGKPIPPGEGKPGKEGKKSEGAEKEGSKKEGAPDSTIVNRPTKPENPADPRQLEIQPDADGKIVFNFTGQPWPAVLQWLADVSKLSLDWQELPDGYLNLRTQRGYTLAEAQDLINRHLLARGFTMLQSGEMLTVVNIAKLNPALVPRLNPEQLSDCRDYEFVKVSFPLRWMLAEKAVTELKPMLSSNGKMTPLKEINRVEAMDAAINLREIQQILQSEQSPDATKNTVVRRFKLEHRRASEVIVMLETMLGLDKKPGSAASKGSGNRGGDGNSQVMQQLQQMQQQMQQQQNRGNQGGGGSTPEAEPRLVVNDRENTIFASAPPDKMELIVQMVAAIDVPSESADQLMSNVAGVRSYRLSTIAPQPLLEILKELGDLSPQSRLQVDEKNSTLILYGTLADHYTVQMLIKRLDGSTRTFEVIQLRRTVADQVAGTIQYMLNSKDEDKNKNNNRGYFSFYGQQSQSNDNEDKRPFKVDADVEQNRLLLWANEVEMKEVKNLLAKMGEVVPGISNPETVRTIELPSDQDAERLLERVKQLWPDAGGNELQIQPVAPQQPAAAQEPGKKADGREVRLAPAQSLRLANMSGDDHAGQGTSPHPLTQGSTKPVPPVNPFDALSLPEDSFNSPQPQQSAPPIRIRRGPNGRLIIGSEDTDALDQLEDLINEISPPRKDYKVFHLKYPNTYAYDVEWILNEYFKGDEKKDGNRNNWMDWYFGSSSGSSDKESLRMSKRKELKIIGDEYTKTILVQGATPQQLAVIEELINTYDKPASSDPQSQRRTEYFTLKYSDAETVATTIKQIYRDLLSANDPALQAPKQDGQDGNEQRNITYNYGGNDGAGKKQRTGSTDEPRRYKGLLSVGVDPVSNTVVVSAIELLMPEIKELVTLLDEQANPHTAVQVIAVQNAGAKSMKEQFDKVFGFQPTTVRTSRTGDRRRSEVNNGAQNQNGNNNRNGNSNNNRRRNDDD